MNTLHCLGNGSIWLCILELSIYDMAIPIATSLSVMNVVTTSFLHWNNSFNLFLSHIQFAWWNNSWCYLIAFINTKLQFGNHPWFFISRFQPNHEICTIGGYLSLIINPRCMCLNQVHSWCVSTSNMQFGYHFVGPSKSTLQWMWMVLPRNESDFLYVTMKMATNSLTTKATTLHYLISCTNL